MKQEIAARTGYSEVIVEVILDGMIRYIREKLSECKDVSIREFGVFESKLVGAREARNPKTGELVHVEPKIRPNFRFSDSFKESINPTTTPPPIIPLPESKIWYTQKNGVAELISDSEFNQLPPNSLVWKIGMTQWSFKESVV